jgi:hypothetical protein
MSAAVRGTGILFAILVGAGAARAQSAPPDPSPPLPATPAPELVYVTPVGAQPATLPTAPAPAAVTSETTVRPDQGLFAGLTLGVGAAFGASTAAAFHEGVGAEASAGWSFGHFALGAFGQWSRTAFAFAEGTPEKGSGSLGLLGVEGRFILGASDPISAWGALGLAYGGGTLSDEAADREYEVNFGATPMLAFGAGVRILGGLRVGPSVFWYVMNPAKVCEIVDVSGESRRDCDSSPDEEIAPDLLFVGLAAHYSDR